jgi:hypothetical protein
LVSGGSKASIPATSSTPSAHNQALIWFYQIPEQQAAAFLPNDRPWWNRDNHILTRTTRFVSSTTSFPILCTKLAASSKRGKRIASLVDNQDDISAFSTIATIWPSTRDVLLTPKMDRSIAAPSRRNLDCDLVKKHKLVFRGKPGSLYS